MIDSHAHLTFPELANQVEDVLLRATQAGVATIITVGTQLDDARAAIDVAERFPDQVRAAVGFHPHEAGKIAPPELDEMACLWDHALVVAAGEMGLDYHYDFSPREAQKAVFAAQLARVQDGRLPIIIHSRDAFDDTVAMLLEHGFAERRVMFHCFTGTAEEAQVIAEHGWRISFTGIVTFLKSTWLQAIARAYPADMLMIETDSPYLSPEPLRGRRPNEPAHVAHIASFLAALRGVDEAEFAAQSADNTRAFFGL